MITSVHLDELDLVVTVGHGPLTRQDVEAFARGQIASDRWPYGRLRLADLTSVQSSLTPPDAAAIAELYRTSTPEMRSIRQAIVASPRWDLARGFERHFDGDGSHTIVFNDLFGACRWLDVDFTTVHAVVARLRGELDGAP